jgi:hypothetical protein
MLVRTQFLSYFTGALIAAKEVHTASRAISIIIKTLIDIITNMEVIRIDLKTRKARAPET